MKILGIIPARFGATRFPGKPLANINGKSMIQRVYEQCCQSKMLNKVVVATDCPYIYETINNLGGKVIFSKQQHESGTSRCAEAYILLNDKFDYVINVQGDEPFIHPNQIDELATFINEKKTGIATQIKKEFQLDLLNNSNIVKVVTDDGINAKKFTRNPICLSNNYFYKHIGLYAFDSEILQKIVLLETTPNELMERLEQLKWLDNHFNISLQETDYHSKSIDSLNDL